MLRLFPLLGLLFIASCPSKALADEDDYTSVFPSPQSYLRRNTPRTTIIGNYLYIDGGDISFLDADGELRDPIQKCLNATLSIDISQSWNTFDVKIKSIPKSSPSLTGQAISRDPNSDSFYIWGGNSGLSEERDKVSKTSQWKFIVDQDGQGGGMWTMEQPANSDLLQRLTISQDGAYTTAKDTLFYVGGMASGWTEPNRLYVQPVPGVLSFNMSTKVWRNDSAEGLSAFGTLNMGVAEYVPRFGPNGIILVLGGTHSKLDPSDKVDGVQEFNTIKFFDPITKVWYSQKATGMIPTPRTRPCSVGVEDPESGTYEIFVFGGTDQINKKTFDDVYVLSLPGFVWHKVENRNFGGPRSGHSCIVIGKRQMLSVGGVDDHDGYNPTLWSTRDNWSNGMAILDLPTMTWGSRYDAGADNYTSPDVIKEWYDKGGIDSVTWSSNEVQQLFAQAVENAGPSNSEPGSSSEDESKRHTPTGTIIGGVLGGAAFLAVIVGVAFWFYKRQAGQRLKRASQPVMGAGPVEAEGQNVRPIYYELGTEEQSRELQGTTVLQKHELSVAKEVP